jgi:hypothetical protein
MISSSGGKIETQESIQVEPSKKIKYELKSEKDSTVIVLILILFTTQSISSDGQSSFGLNEIYF